MPGTTVEVTEWVKCQVETCNSREIAKLIKSELRRRSGKAWSVTCGRGTAASWINVGGYDMSAIQRDELAKLLGLPHVHQQGEGIPASMAYRRVALARAACGQSLGFTADQYWD